MAKAHKKSLFERQIPVIPLRNCESKNLGFKGETSGIIPGIISNSGMWQSISLIKYAMDSSAEHSKN